MLKTFDRSITSFELIRDFTISHQNIDELETLSNIAKRLEIIFEQDALDKIERQKFKPNLESCTEHLIIITEGW
jgi:hypothetical protein